MTGIRFKVVPDEDPDLSWLEQWDTPETYEGNEILDEGTGEPMPFEEYMRTYGDPSRHVTLAMIAERATYDGAAFVRPGRLYSKNNPSYFETCDCGDYCSRCCPCFECREIRTAEVEAGEHPDLCQWEEIGSLWGIDFMDWNDPPCGTLDLEELTDPYLKKIAEEMAAEFA